MKFSLTSILVALILSGTLFGCATPKILYPAIPAVPASTNQISGVITPATPAVAAVVTNLPNVTVEKIVADGNAAAPFIPAPYGTAVSSVLALLALGAGWIAQSKNKQLNTANAVTTAIVQGVASAGTAAAAVKLSVAKISKANGVSDAVETAVNNVIGKA